MTTFPIIPGSGKATSILKTHSAEVKKITNELVPFKNHVNPPNIEQIGKMTVLTADEFESKFSMGIPETLSMLKDISK